MRIKGMILTEEALDFCVNSPCQYHRRYIENSMENKHTDVRVFRTLMIFLISLLYV